MRMARRERKEVFGKDMEIRTSEKVVLCYFE